MNFISTLSKRTILAFLLIATIGFGAYAGTELSGNIITSGQEPSGVVKNRKAEAIRVWPSRVSTTLNVANLQSGEVVVIYTEDGTEARRGASGNDGFVQFDLTDFEPGHYTVSAGEQNVKIVKL